MACELIGAKLMAPYFGTSLYVWASVLGLTLGGLTLGYFYGGKLSKRYNNNAKLLYYVLLLASFFLVIMPFTSILIMNQTIQLSLEMGAIISLILFMMPPLILMGMVSPIIINLLTEESDSAGYSAGTVYAISTLGGILYTFLMGFFIIPTFGLKIPAIVSGLILASIPAILLLKTKQKKMIILLLAIFLGSFASLYPKSEFNDEFNVLYQSDGILGQIKVVDHPSYEITDDARVGRALLVNNTLQTYMGVEDDFKYSIWNWSHYFPTAASIFPPKSKVLLLGLGGGTIVKQMNRLDYDVDVVEIDKRVGEVSIEYFNLDPSTKITIDDARHYIKTTKETYDIIIFDTFLSESVPEHLLTIEGFEDVKRILNKGGMVMSNFYGYIDGKEGKAARSVYKTFEKAGFYVDLLATPGQESSRNLIFLASMDEKDFSKTNYSEPNYERIENLYDFFIEKRFIDLTDAELLSDHKPKLTKLYTKAARDWKMNYNEYYRKHFLE